MLKRILPAMALALLALFGAYYWLDLRPGGGDMSAGAGTASAGPAIWEVEGGNARMVLLGSFHVMKRDADWRTPVIMDAFKGADTLVVEIDLSRYSQQQIWQATAKYALLPKGKTLQSVLDGSTYAEVTDRARTLGVDSKAIDTFRPWFAGLTLEQAELAQQGYTAEMGVDETLMAAAKDTDKTILPLETFDEQISILATPPEGDINAYMKEYLDELSRSKQEFSRIDEIWRRGDVAGLENYLKTEHDNDPGVFAAVYTARNRSWLPRFEEMLKGSGTYFVVVGAGHLVGKDGVVALLRQAGYTVHRL